MFTVRYEPAPELDFDPFPWLVITPDGRSMLAYETEAEAREQADRMNRILAEDN